MPARAQSRWHDTCTALLAQRGAVQVSQRGSVSDTSNYLEKIGHIVILTIFKQFFGKLNLTFDSSALGNPAGY